MSKNMPEQSQPKKIYIRGPRVSKGGNLAHFAHFRAREVLSNLQFSPNGKISLNFFSSFFGVQDV